MTSHLKPALYALIGTACIVLWSSCRKNPVQPQPETGNKTLAVKLDNSYLGPALVDSAFAIWEINNQQKRIALTKSGDTLIAPIDQFDIGNGKLTIQIFSRIKFGVHYLSQWVFNQSTTINHNSGFITGGPENFSDIRWKPRVELKDGIGHYAVVALRPDDPYFFVRDVPGNLQSLIVARDYWKTGGGVTRAGGGEWECSFNCVNSKGHVENNQFFSFLPAQMGTNPWNHIEITILYTQDQWGGGSVLSMTHTL